MRAGGMHTFNGEANISRLQKYTIDLYREIEALSGQFLGGLHTHGGLMLARPRASSISLKLICSRCPLPWGWKRDDLAREARNFNPLIDASHFIGALWRADGAIAIRRAPPMPTSRRRASSVRRWNASHRVLSLGQRRDGTWDVVTDKGTVHAEHVVNCAGLWAREIDTWSASSCGSGPWSTTIC